MTYSEEEERRRSKSAPNKASPTRIRTTLCREPDGQDMNIHKSPYSAEEEDGGRRKEEKDGPLIMLAL